jgi:hypothetical protein
MFWGPWGPPRSPRFAKCRTRTGRFGTTAFEGIIRACSCYAWGARWHPSRFCMGRRMWFQGWVQRAACLAKSWGGIACATQPVADLENSSPARASGMRLACVAKGATAAAGAIVLSRSMLWGVGGRKPICVHIWCCIRKLN